MTVTIDFVAFDEEQDAWLLVLVEGPWKEAVEDHLRTLQNRLYGCLEAALDGQIAEQFPDSAGKRIIIQVDCYNMQREDVDDFVDQFAAGLREVPDYSAEASPWVRSIEFEVHHEQIH